MFFVLQKGKREKPRPLPPSITYQTKPWAPPPLGSRLMYLSGTQNSASPNTFCLKPFLGGDGDVIALSLPQTQATHQTTYTTTQQTLNSNQLKKVKEKIKFESALPVVE
nr:unnamed protein product [Callosobruchus analis]